MSGCTRPSFQFYPADWLRNAKLRHCSYAARGAWADLMCMFHDSDEYGVLRWPLADIAHAAGIPIKLLRELAGKGVLKGGDVTVEPFRYRTTHAGKPSANEWELVRADGGPCWYSSRMVRDEWVRHRRGFSTHFEPGKKASPKVKPTPTPNPPIGLPLGDGSSASASASASEKPNTRRIRAGARGISYTEDFEALWAAYPQRSGGNSKADAWKQYLARQREGVSHEDMIAGVRRYAAFLQSDGSAGTRFVKQAATFLGTGEHFRDAWALQTNGHDRKSAPILTSGEMI